jgi:anti-sigma B factor antagonist
MADLADFDPLYFSIREERGVAVAGFKMSQITEEENIEQLGHELFSLTDQFGCRKLVLDMRGVEYITSAVIGKLISLHRRMHRSGGSLVLCNLGTKLREVLRTSRLIDYFQSAETVDDAVGRLVSSSDG